MNMLLWILQAALALLFLAGGGYKLSSANQLTKQLPALPRGGWRMLGIIEILGSILLVVPAAFHWMPSLTPLAAVVLAIETLALAVFYARYSLKLVASNPMVWALGMGVLVALVAYGRFGH
jgi:hypothetical protein